ncbi:T9SS type A sorting domain-containing protein [Belliella marina]|uniref:T9SS type A sorting domain-containing protein n=1 Tax=Belliella marina TaxID=1644146 RepID=A0ABW4VKB6_9BACT
MSFAQNARVYADFGVESGRSTILGLPTASVTNPNNARDANPQTFATLNVNLGLGNFAWIRPRFDHTVPAGTKIRIKVGKSSGLLELASNVSIRAYLGGTQVSTTINLSSLIGLLGGEEVSELVFIPENAGGVEVSFDRIEINLSSLLGLGLSFDVYDVYYLSDEFSVCESVKDVLYGSTSGLLGGLNPVIDPGSAFDGDLDTYADLRGNVTIGNKTHVTALFDDPSRSGDSVHVVLRNPGGLLNLSLLAEQFAINTYMDNEPVENMALLESFLTLTLLPGESDIYKLSFPANQPFNRIEVALAGGLLNALDNLHVFEVSRTEHSAEIEIEDEEGHVFCVGESLTFTQEVIYPGDTYEWRIGGNPVGYNGSLILPDDLPAGDHQVELYTNRSGCLNPTEATTIGITLIDVPDKEYIDVIPTGEAERNGDYFVYYEGYNPITLSPVYNTDLQGDFSWYLDAELTMPIYDGMVDFDGTVYNIDGNNILTIENWVFRDPDTYEFFLAYTNELGCMDVKPFNFESIFVILPLDILDFETHVKARDQVHISWKSEMEEGFFELQKAGEDLKFHTISKIPINPGNKRYLVIDAFPMQVNYYRVLHAGKGQNNQSFSSLKRVVLPHLIQDQSIINVYPNPFVNEIHVQTKEEIGEVSKIRIVSADGNNILLDQKLEDGGPSGLITIPNLGHLQKGVYILQIYGKSKLYTAKIIK